MMSSLLFYQWHKMCEIGLIFLTCAQVHEHHPRSTYAWDRLLAVMLGPHATSYMSEKSEKRS